MPFDGIGTSTCVRVGTAAPGGHVYHGLAYYSIAIVGIPSPGIEYHGILECMPVHVYVSVHVYNIANNTGVPVDCNHIDIVNTIPTQSVGTGPIPIAIQYSLATTCRYTCVYRSMRALKYSIVLRPPS